LRFEYGLISVLIILVGFTFNFSFAEDEPYVLSHFYAKSVVSENNPFGGKVFWTIVDGQTGTVVTSSNKGVTVIRLDMTQSDSCEKLADIVCLDATITDTKNTLFTKNGDTAKFVFEMPNKQSISILSGDLATLEIELDIKKMIVKEVTEIIEDEIEESSLDSLKREAKSKLLEALELTKDPQIQQFLKESNDEFESLEIPIVIMDRRNEEWISAGDEVTPFMGSIMGNKISQFLVDMMLEDQKKPTDFVYEEIILTNSWGANVAQTGRTTDYMQWDEPWWMQAKRNGGNFQGGFDESAGVQSLDMSVRISDEEGRFLGVIKFVINAEKLN